MEPCSLHLRQGDLFARLNAPVIDVQVGDRNWSSHPVPALLVSQNCIIDKRSRAGDPTIRNLQFLPARRVDILNDQNREAVLRQRNVQPADPFLVGAADDGYEYYALLSELFSVPIECLGRLGWDEQDADDWRLTAPDAVRLGRITDEDLDLLQQKMMAFWAGYRLPNSSESDLP